MSGNNVKTTFRLPSGVNEDFIRNLIRQHHQQQQHHKKSITTKYQTIHIRCLKIYTGKDLC